VIMKYFNDISNRLFKQLEDESVLEVFSGEKHSAIEVYVVETLDVQLYITEAIMIFMNRRRELKNVLWRLRGGAYYGVLKQVEDLDAQIARANAELKLI
jgi:hypothetical protein